MSTDVIAANVRAEVARRSMRQETLADSLGLNQRAVSRRLRGEVAWSIVELQRLAELLDVPLTTLAPPAGHTATAHEAVIQ